MNPLKVEEEKCAKFGWNDDQNKQVCTACEATHVLTKNHECSVRCAQLDNSNNCIAEINMSHCELLNEKNGSTCLQCADSHLLVGGLCVDKTTAVQHCKNYDENLSKYGSVAVCSECVDEKYLKTPSQCVDIPLENCAKFDKATKDCTKCKNGYQKVVKKNGEQFCYKVESASEDNQDQCAEWDNDEF